MNPGNFRIISLINMCCKMCKKRLVHTFLESNFKAWNQIINLIDEIRWWLFRTLKQNDTGRWKKISLYTYTPGTSWNQKLCGLKQKNSLIYNLIDGFIRISFVLYKQPKYWKFHWKKAHLFFYVLHQNYSKLDIIRCN